MKICQLTTSLSFAGAEQIILDITSMKEHTFIIVALQEGDGSFRKMAEKKGLQVFCLDMKSKLDFSVFAKLKHLLNEENIDCLHSHLVHANFVGRISAASAGIPALSTIHIVEKRFKPSHKWMELLTVRKAERVTAGTGPTQLFERPVYGPKADCQSSDFPAF